MQVDRFDGLTPESSLADAYQDILSFEKQLSDDGTVIIKLFLYIDKEEQDKRFKKLDRVQGEFLARHPGGFKA